jgi:hypothetical protein
MTPKAKQKEIAKKAYSKTSSRSKKINRAYKKKDRR